MATLITPRQDLPPGADPWKFGNPKIGYPTFPRRSLISGGSSTATGDKFYPAPSSWTKNKEGTHLLTTRPATVPSKGRDASPIQRMLDSRPKTRAPLSVSEGFPGATKSVPLQEDYTVPGSSNPGPIWHYDVSVDNTSTRSKYAFEKESEFVPPGPIGFNVLTEEQTERTERTPRHTSAEFSGNYKDAYLRRAQLNTPGPVEALSRTPRGGPVASPRIRPPSEGGVRNYVPVPNYHVKGRTHWGPSFGKMANLLQKEQLRNKASGLVAASPYQPTTGGSLGTATLKEKGAPGYRKPYPLEINLRLLPR